MRCGPTLPKLESAERQLLWGLPNSTWSRNSRRKPITGAFGLSSPRIESDSVRGRTTPSLEALKAFSSGEFHIGLLAHHLERLLDVLVRDNAQEG
jgi:hypothetical protein